MKLLYSAVGLSAIAHCLASGSEVQSDGFGLSSSERRSLIEQNTVGIAASPTSWLLSVDDVRKTDEFCMNMSAQVEAKCAAAEEDEMGRKLRGGKKHRRKNRAMRFKKSCIVAFECLESTIFSTDLDSIEGFHPSMIERDMMATVIEPPSVDVVEPQSTPEEVSRENLNQEFSASSGSSDWGLLRLMQLAGKKRGNFDPTFTGKGVTVYMLDTGILSNHEEYKGRVTAGKNFDASSSDTEDENGHGSHTAGTVAGTNYGVAPDAELIAVKVLDKAGSGAFSQVVAGVHWVVQQHKKSGKTAVMSMSIGGPGSKSLDKAMEEAIHAGMIVAVAAGNNNDDAKKYSPARSGGSARSKGGVITVMASDKFDNLASYSNYGRNTDIIAPGTMIESAWNTSPTATKTISGTSMACPHVAGVAAQLLEKHAHDRTKAMAELFANVASDRINMGKRGRYSPNLLLQQASTYSGPPTKAPTAPPSAPYEGEPVLEKSPFSGKKDRIEFEASTFGPLISDSVVFEGQLVVSETLKDGCSKSDYNGAKNKVALVVRGKCKFEEKVKMAQQAGVKALIISQDGNAVPFPPSSSDENFHAKIISGMISRDSAEELKTSSQVRMGPTKLVENKR